MTAELVTPAGWTRIDERFERTFSFADFSTAFGFMCRSALVAESINHHPDWSNVYNTVTVALTTHDANGLTQLDVDLAEAMNRIADTT